MLADIHQIITEAETKMSSAIRYLDDELARIRAGKASPRILDNVKVSYYGSMTPLANVSSITTPDAKTMIITPWEKPMLKEIEKAILSSEVGITPENNGEVIRRSPKNVAVHWPRAPNNMPKRQRSASVTRAGR